MVKEKDNDEIHSDEPRVFLDLENSVKKYIIFILKTM